MLMLCQSHEHMQILPVFNKKKKEIGYLSGNPLRLYPLQNLENHHLTPVFTDPLVF
jgi:hypothetical protein